MKKVALIGASGFVGSTLLDELVARGHKVTAIVRHPEKVTVKNDNVTVVKADAADTNALAQAVESADAVISAYCGGWGNPNQYEDTLKTYPKIVEGVKRSGVERLLIVGGAGVLFVKPGLRLVDTGSLPEAWVQGVKSAAEFYLGTLSKEDGIDWVYLCPPANLGNMGKGVRTGKYRTGTDTMLADESGNSFISVEDYAVAMVDELEKPAHHKELFTVAY